MYIFWGPETSLINPQYSISGGNLVAGRKMVKTNRGLSSNYMACSSYRSLLNF